jgi:hypothetical protein
VTERGNPRNRRGIAAVTAFVDAPVLAGGVELVDTPGTGSVFGWDTDAAHQALETKDAAVFVLTADPPVSAAERDLLGRVRELSVMTFAVLNKADHLNEAGLAEAAVESRLAADLKTELDMLRGSAAELLGLDLAAPEPGGRLADDRRFFCTTAEDAGQTELRMQAALRAAADMRTASDADAKRMQAELAGREAALRDVLGGLDEAQAG